MNQRIKQLLAIIIIISIFMIIGLTVFFGITGNSAFLGMLGLMFFYPLFLWILIFLYKKMKK